MRLLLCALLAVLLSTIVAADGAAFELRVGNQLLDDLALYVNHAVPNITKLLLPIPLPPQNVSKLNVEAYIFNVSLVSLTVSPAEISIDPSEGFVVAMYVRIARPNLTSSARKLR